MTDRGSTTVDDAQGTSPPGPSGAPPPPAEVRRARRALVAMAVGGVAVDVGVRGGGIGLGSTVALGVAALAVLVTCRRRAVETWALTAVALVLAGCLSVRTSPWIVVLDWVAVIGLLGLAATTRAGLPVVGQSLVALARRATLPWLAAPATSVIEPIEVAQVLGRHRRARRPPAEERRAQGRSRTGPGHAGAVLRGIVLAVPVLVVLGLLLGSADAVFASFFSLPTLELDVAGAVGHVVLFGIGAAAVAALLGADRQVRPLARSTARPLGAIEATVVLTALALLYALFAVAQLVAAIGGDGRVGRTTGLTYAEYARSGFFQLLWAAGITLVVLLGIRALTRDTTPAQDLAVRLSSATCCALTLVLVAAAINRLAVYRDAYGLTMLRLACTTFAWFLGATFLLLGARLVQGRSGRDWLPAAMAVTALVALLWWNGSNPEAHVARTNIDRAVATGKLDVDHAASQSADAVPTLVAGLDELPPDVAQVLSARLCAPPDRADSGRDGWAAWNRADQAAQDARAAC